MLTASSVPLRGKGALKEQKTEEENAMTIELNDKASGKTSGQTIKLNCIIRINGSSIISFSMCINIGLFIKSITLVSLDQKL